VIGIYLVALTVTVIYAALSCAASHNTPADDPRLNHPRSTP